MLPVLKKTYDYFENLKGKKLAGATLVLVVISLVLGILIGQVPSFFSLLGGKTELLQGGGTDEGPVSEKFGRVVYVDPSKFPGELISYKLIDEKSGKDVILLKSSDDKLKLIEGGIARLRGKIEKTAEGEEVLVVERIVFQ